MDVLLAAGILGSGDAIDILPIQRHDEHPGAIGDVVRIHRNGTHTGLGACGSFAFVTVGGGKASDLRTVSQHLSRRQNDESVTDDGHGGFSRFLQPLACPHRHDPIFRMTEQLPGLQRSVCFHAVGIGHRSGTQNFSDLTGLQYLFRAFGQSRISIIDRISRQHLGVLLLSTDRFCKLHPMAAGNTNPQTLCLPVFLRAQSQLCQNFFRCPGGGGMYPDSASIGNRIGHRPSPLAILYRPPGSYHQQYGHDPSFYKQPLFCYGNSPFLCSICKNMACMAIIYPNCPVGFPRFPPRIRR